jgi:hypothetical protein
MAGEKQIFSYKAAGFAIEIITDRIDEWNKSVRRIKWYKRNGEHTHQSQYYKGIQRCEKQHWVAETTGGYNKSSAPYANENGNGKIDRPEIIYHKVFKLGTVAHFYVLEENRKDE